ncbi:hypothetical protein INS49_008493 [Diaporthe citri]|uniref:uncharacterized protein n=1 Tax=Diaporthe citri TaxID=83186 RepID=UPI001C824ADE|nr:uncharacterized protein INS49_008493 [Diaporthe citri]KAG6363394.1 hypothetical protein INS49_008493 [Diaporthe citri]
MSQQRVARRSASHGALSSSYAAQGRAGSDSGHQLPPFKPLRSIREHTFLDPAASAEGMLRKTTETGNIGIFSINVTRTHDQLYRRPSGLRARASLNDLRQPSRPWSSSSDRLAGRDDRKQLPSYRDSTSEIISMYGSENHSSKSLSSSLTTPCDEYGPRSYSMTSCGPRGYFMQRHNGGQHLQDYQGRIQRPRSPYPYPTRLPRHGIRPASPALTESGDVDYSRMVEIDRISYRTTHHPHKTLFPYKTTRNPLPLSLKQDANLSTRSLSDNHVTARLYPPRPRNRPPLPSHLHEWGVRPRERLESGSSDQSLRTMSLKSMSGGYGQASSRARGIATVQKKPLFYDYSEDFEDIIEPPPVVPIAPIPRRVSNSFRRVVFQNNSGEGPDSMEDVQNEFEAYLQGGANARHHPEEGNIPIDAPVQPISLPPGDAGVIPRQPADDHIDSHPSTQMAAPAVDCRDLTPVLDESVQAENTSAEKDMGQVKESTVVEITSDASTLDDLSEPKTPAFTAGGPFHEVMGPNEDVDPCRDSHDGRVTVRNFVLSQGHDTLPVLSKATPASSPTSHQTNDIVSTLPRTPGPEDPDIACSESQESHPRTQTDEAAATVKNSPCLREDEEPGPEKVTNAVSHPPRMSSLRENRRKATALRVNTAVDEPHQYQVVSTREGPTLTPQPISPAKLLRVKNSIPQLMKALPPLPGYAPAPESPFGPAVMPMEFEPFEISQLTDARSTLIDAFQADEAPKGYDAFIFDRDARKPRLKLKHATAFAVEHERSSRREYTTPKSASRPDTSVKRPTTSTRTSTAAAAATEYSTAPVKRRLPIKVSRPMLTPLLPDDAGTVKRRPGIQKSSTVSELVSQEPIDLFSSAVALQTAVANSHVSSTQQRILHNRVHVDTPMVKVTPVARIRQVPADAETRGTSLDAHMDMLRVPSVDSQPGVESEIQSFFSDNSIVKPRQGLRTRISNLKSKLAESRNLHRSPLSKLPQDDRLEDQHRKDDNRDGVGASLSADSQPTGTYKELSASTSNSKAHPQVIAKRGVRSKLEKFMKGAKHKLRTWGKAKRRID